MTAWSRLLAPIQRHFRIARVKKISALFPEAKGRVLDLGGSLHFWEAVGDILDPAELVILNIAYDGQSCGAVEGENDADRTKIVLYDGKRIPFEDNAFDLVICNSVIEHVPPGERIALAREIARVSKNYVIQTPALEFPIEPHFMAPFIHWLPRSIGRRAAHLSPYAFFARNYRFRIGTYFDEVRLLSKKEAKALAPGARLRVERLAGLPKSYLICSR